MRPTGTGEVVELRFADDGRIPNNPGLPALMWRGALADADAAATIALFASNGWEGAWVDGVYPFHHFHSTAHEVLGVVGGSGRLTLGGPGGETFTVERGDVLVIPAGVGHCRRSATPGFTVVGAYPRGQTWDLLTGEPGERERALANIPRVPLPEADPVAGPDGPVVRLWLRGSRSG